MWSVGFVAFLAVLFNTLLLTPSQAEPRSKAIRARDIAQLARLQRKLARAIEDEDPSTTPAPSDAPLLPSEGLGSAILPINTICDVQRKCKKINPENQPNGPPDNQNQYPPQFPSYPPKRQNRYPPYPQLNLPNFPIYARFNLQYPSYQPNIDYSYNAYEYLPNPAPYGHSHYYPSYDQPQYPAPYDQPEHYPYPPSYDQTENYLYPPINNQPYPPSNIQPRYPNPPPDQHQYYPYPPSNSPPNYPYPYYNCGYYPPCSCYHGHAPPSNVASSPKPPKINDLIIQKPLLNESPAPKNIPEPPPSPPPAATVQTQKPKRDRKKSKKRNSTEEDESDFYNKAS